MTLKEHEIRHFDYTKYFFCYFVLGNIYALGGPENFGFINGKKTQVIITFCLFIIMFYNLSIFPNLSMNGASNLKT